MNNDLQATKNLLTQLGINFEQEIEICNNEIRLVVKVSGNTINLVGSEDIVMTYKFDCFGNFVIMRVDD